ncbi:MAG: glycosyltransferase family 39 protein [Actinobacteria bacterium]|nr:glycosyltransferase family 39 protein [Actinomycetota bacterium]
MDSIASSPGTEGQSPTARPQGSRRAAWLLAAVVTVTAAAALHTASALAPAEGYDGAAFVRYAEILRAEGRLPTEAESYEFTAPPAYPALAVALSGAAEAAGAGVSWVPGQLLSIVWVLGLLGVTWLLARELWPDCPLLWALAAAAAAGLPVVVRLGAMFHPEAQFAFLASLALLLAVRARRGGWAARSGILLGAVLGLAALTRPTAAVVIVSLGAVILVSGRRAALRFAGVTFVVCLLVAGPWWLSQSVRHGNPLESNLDRYILAEGQPRSFYASLPLEDLVLRPYRPHFAGELLPQVHADLWSDWFGARHDYWRERPGGATRVFLSSQSALGLLAGPLALSGLLGFGGAALGRLVRRVERGPRDFALAACLVLAALSWAGFVIQLVRFPQAGGDPIKSSYLLHLAPVFALSGLAAGQWLWRRGAGFRLALLAFAGLYALSWAGFTLTAS